MKYIIILELNELTNLREFLTAAQFEVIKTNNILQSRGLDKAINYLKEGLKILDHTREDNSNELQENH